MSPTGYTAALYEGKEQSFEEFVWSCARAFGALVLLRDDTGARIPKQFEPRVDYEAKAIEEAQKRLAELEAMTESDAAAEQEARAADIKKDNAEDKARRDAMRRRYEDRLAEVYAWDPPTEEHRGLKDFMVQQLTSSIEHDCSPYEREIEILEATEYIEREKASARRTIELSEKHIAEEIERTNSRNNWLAALQESVPPPEKVMEPA